MTAATRDAGCHIAEARRKYIGYAEIQTRTGAAGIAEHQSVTQGITGRDAAADIEIRQHDGSFAETQCRPGTGNHGHDRGVGTTADRGIVGQHGGAEIGTGNARLVRNRAQYAVINRGVEAELYAGTGGERSYSPCQAGCGRSAGIKAVAAADTGVTVGQFIRHYVDDTQIRGRARADLV